MLPLAASYVRLVSAFHEEYPDIGTRCAAGQGYGGSPCLSKVAKSPPAGSGPGARELGSQREKSARGFRCPTTVDRHHLPGPVSLKTPLFTGGFGHWADAPGRLQARFCRSCTPGSPSHTLPVCRNLPAGFFRDDTGGVAVPRVGDTHPPGLSTDVETSVDKPLRTVVREGKASSGGTVSCRELEGLPSHPPR